MAQISEKEEVCADSVCDTHKGAGETVEIANFNLNLGFKSFFSSKRQTLLQVPLFLELKFPIITEDGNVKWLLQGGGGWMGFVNIKKRESTSVDSFSYFLTRTGLQYDFDSMNASLVGGAVFVINGPSTVGWTGGLNMYVPLLRVFHVKLGLEALYYERTYWGISMVLGFSLKTWKQFISEI